VQTDFSEQKSENPSISLRPVQPEDAGFLLEVYASTRASEMALVPWNDEQRQAFLSSQFAAQQDFYTQKYPQADHSIIQSDGRAVGRLYLARLEDQLRIVDVTVLPKERNAGFGSYLLKELQGEARRSGKPVRIYVENFNPSLRLFERLGFQPVEEQGVHLLLQWSPQPGGLSREAPAAT
jgi:N-acetylglutamate synthase-like GNAT family acetyltransferase